jgi:ribokinase
MFDVISIGSATRDAFLISKEFRFIRSDEFPTGIGECVSFGSKIELDKLVLTTGGGGTNSATTFARLGLKTAIITKIGADASGQEILAQLRQDGVETTLVKTIKGGQTAYSSILTAPNGERSILVDRGVAKTFTEGDIAWNKLKAKWIYLTSLGGNLALALKIAKQAKANGAKIFYNPGYEEVKRGLKALEPMRKLIDVLSLNLEEAQRLTGLETRDVKTLGKKILIPGLTLLLTDGQNGAYGLQGAETWFIRPRPVKVISRTGAGDAFGSGVVAGLNSGWNLQDAMRLGLHNAESVIKYYGAKQGIVSKLPSGASLKKINVRSI